MKTYEDLWHAAQFYKNALRFEAVIIILIALVIMRFFRIVPTFHFFYQVLKDSLRIYAPKALLITLLLICYAIIAAQIWHVTYYGFKDVSNSILYILLIFELSTGDGNYDLYEQLIFPYEKGFGLLLIIMTVVTILYVTMTTAVVVKSFDRHLEFLKQTKEEEKPPHYMIKWFKAAKLDKIFFVHKCKKKRQNQYALDSKDEANLEMIRTINNRN